jgi:2-phosphosulfolactate phosphatase
LAGNTVVVIDLLRASSTICQALASGACEVVPFLEVDEALAAADAAARSEIVLGGERKGGKIPGFDLGNSPSEYTREAVQGRRVFITTTNGTRALYHARAAQRVVVGSFVNLSAAMASIQNEPHVELLCAGTDGGPTREDLLTAGAFVHQLRTLASANWHLNDAAAAAERKWTLLVKKARAVGRAINEHLAIELRETPGGRNLLGMGLNKDLVDCAQIDCLNIVPEFHVQDRRITVPPGGKSAC